jgi:hypothetical protein
MSLSNKTVQNLSIALTPEVINAIYADERWNDFMCEVIPEIVSKKLGFRDMNLVTEIAMCIVDNILLNPIRTV